MIIRWLFFISCMIASLVMGGITGIFYGFVIFGLLALCWYMITDTLHTVKAAVRRPNVTVDSRSVNVFPGAWEPSQARRGTPTTDDFAGMIEYRKNT